MGLLDSNEEKTEQATPRRRDDARSEGNVAWSRDLASAALLTAGLLAFRTAGDGLTHALETLTTRFLDVRTARLITIPGTPGFVRDTAGQIALALAPIILILLAVAAISNFGQIGFVIASKKIRFDPSRLDPMRGLQRIFFSKAAFAALLVATAKVAVIVLFVRGGILAALPSIARLPELSPGAMAAAFAGLLFLIGFRVAAALLVIGAADFAWQRWKHNRDLMMSRSERRDDEKRSEGDPTVKGRIRKMQRQFAKARLAIDVPRSTVVVKNPTHYAVALRYERGQDRAPRVMAKGRGLMALAILRIAARAGVPVVENRPLARQLYALARPGAFIPEPLYRAVAEVLAYVYRREAAAGRRRRIPAARSGRGDRR